MSERKPPWPHGKPTVMCERCGGTGLDRRRTELYVASKAHYDDDKARIGQAVCELCSGRGRVIQGY